MHNKRSAHVYRWLLVVAGVLVLLMVMLSQPLATQAQITRTPRVTPTLEPTISAEAEALTGNIVFVSNRSGSYELYITSPDGKDTRALTTENDPNVVKWWPNVSPDGLQIAYVANSAENSQAYEIYTMDIDGGNQQQVTELGMKIFCVDWSPDMTQFVICARPVDDSDEHDIYTLNVDGTELTRLTEDPTRDYDPKWSPDGEKIVFDSDREKEEGGLGHLYVMNADGSDVQQLVPGYSGAWSPDGSQIAYVGDCDTRDIRLGTVCIMNADGSDPHYVPSSLGIEISPQWSPDGKFLVVSSRAVGTEFSANEIYVIAVDSTERIQLTENDEIEDSLAVWGVPPTVLGGEQRE
jgi:TolB protein